MSLEVLKGRTQLGTYDYPLRRSTHSSILTLCARVGVVSNETTECCRVVPHMGFGIRQVSVQVLTLLLTSCAILGELFHFSNPSIIIHGALIALSQVHSKPWRKCDYYYHLIMNFRSYSQEVHRLLEATQRLGGHIMQHLPFADHGDQRGEITEQS